MSQNEKGAYYRALKAAGVEFSKHYREYSTADFRTAYDALGDAAPPLEDKPSPAEPETEPQPPSPEDIGRAYEEFVANDPEFVRQQQAPQVQEKFPPEPELPPLPVYRPPAPTERDPNEMPGMRLNTKDDLDPIRVDEEGRIWFQEEVLKPAFPKPRGRRVLTYTETGTKTVTAKSGDYTETFEVAGDEVGRTSEVKITLPSYQVGIYQDPRMPFRTHCYNGREGFDLFEVEDFWHGAELVPDGVKRVYVENVLCYDIRSVVRAITDEYRQLQLTGKVD